MQSHRIVHRFVSGSEPAQTRIRLSRKEFDVGVARKMLREGATLADIGVAFGVTGPCVHQRLKKLGLAYLTGDRVRVGSARSAGQLRRLSGEA